jgi:hypothetical protein
MKLDVVASLHGFAQLVRDLSGMVVIAAVSGRVLSKLQDFGDVGEYREPGAVAVELIEHSPRRLDHEGQRAALAIAVNLVVQRKDEVEHGESGWVRADAD